HHLDSPLARQDTRLDLTDQYLFRGKAGTALVMDLNSTLSGDARIPGFHPEARYEFKIHFDGADVEDLAFRFAFDERGEDGRQSYTVHRLTGSDARDDEAIGEPVVLARTGVSHDAADGSRIWAGTVADPFYLHFPLLNAVRAAVREGGAIDLAPFPAGPLSDTFAGSSVEAIVLELPDTDPRLSDGRLIAVWSVSKLATDAGGWSQVNRAGLPMIWPIFRPDDSDEASRANLGHPSTDRERYGEQVAKQIAGVARAHGTLESDAYGRRAAELLLPDLLPYRVGTDATFGFAGFNGRSLVDNAPETMFSLTANSAIDTRLRTGPVGEDFPYVTHRTTRT
ncbi:MAG: hypothetical protein AUG49_00240, partial [Catenulispora sp. 13_1_20CM_3_70_7]